MIKQRQVRATETLQMYFLLCLTTLDLQITIWNVWCLQWAFILLLRQTISPDQRTSDVRFAVIDIPDYTSEEKKIIFSKYVLPKVLTRMSLKAEECVVTEDGLDAIVELHKNTSGIRDLEQAAEHIAANALYQIEVDHLTGVTF